MRISWDTGIHNGIHAKMATYLFAYLHDKAVIGIDIGYKWTSVISYSHLYSVLTPRR